MSQDDYLTKEKKSNQIEKFCLLPIQKSALNPENS